MLTIVLGCAEEVPLPDVVPVLRVEGVSSTDVEEFNNAVTLTVYYEDGDGDLGVENPDESVIFVQDSRLDEPDEYHLQPLAPLDSEIPIQGTFDIRLNPLFLLGNGTEETVNLTIQIKDRAGNMSEPADAPPIRVRR